MRLEPVQQFAALTQHGTCRQWLKWLGKQVSGVADWMDNKQWQMGNQVDWLLVTIEELEKARAQIRILEEEL